MDSTDEKTQMPAGTETLNAFRDWLSHNGGRVLMGFVVLMVAIMAAALVFIVGEIVNGGAALVSTSDGAALGSISQKVVIARIGDFEITPTLYNGIAAIAVSAGIVAHALLLMGARHSSGKVLNGIGLIIWTVVSLTLGGVFIVLTNESRGRALDAALIQELTDKGDAMVALVDAGRFVLAAVVPLAIISMIVMTAIGSVMQRGDDKGTGHSFARIVEVVVLGFVVVASGLHAFTFGLYVGFDMFTALAGCVIAELCFVLAKARHRAPALVLSVVYLFLINAAAGIAASGGLEAVRASWLSFSPELYSASPVIFGLVIALMLADQSGQNVPQREAWHVRATGAVQTVKGVRDAWRDALGQGSPTRQIEGPAPSATLGSDGDKVGANIISDGSAGDGLPHSPKS